MQILKLRSDLEKKLRKYSLQKKFQKASRLFENNPRHPSLHMELLEPKHLGIYSFRIDQKFRARFIVVGGKAEIIDISVHYA